MEKTIAIDGACRRNGDPTCISAGACFILDKEDNVEQCYIQSVPETESTSQRGELLGLFLAIEHVYVNKVETVIITDSEYLFNTMTKQWISRWQNNGWLTASGEPVKNKDLWQKIWKLYKDVEDLITFFHIKGHLLSIGAKKYHELMRQDTSGYTLYHKAFTDKQIDEKKLQHAKDLSEANNGFIPDLSLFQQFAAMNLVADAAANLCIEAVESVQWQQFLNNGVLAADSAL